MTNQNFNDNPGVTSRDQLLKALIGQQSKRHVVHDNESRPVLLFEAPIDTPNGGPCLATEYVYVGPNSLVIKSEQERVSRWNSNWENGFIFNPNTSYDPDGDGTL